MIVFTTSSFQVTADDCVPRGKSMRDCEPSFRDSAAWRGVACTRDAAVMTNPVKGSILLEQAISLCRKA